MVDVQFVVEGDGLLRSGGSEAERGGEQNR